MLFQNFRFFHPDCAPQLLDRPKKGTQMPVVVVLANREFECWFLSSKESLRGISGIQENTTAPLNPEKIRGAKEHLTRNMARGRRYLEADDQATFAEKFDLNDAKQSCPSFDRCVREAERLVNAMGAATRQKCCIDLIVRYLRGNQSYQIVEGSSNIQKLIIAQDTLGYRKANRWTERSTPEKVVEIVASVSRGVKELWFTAPQINVGGPWVRLSRTQTSSICNE